MKLVNNIKLILGLSSVLLLSCVAAKTLSFFWIAMWIIAMMIVVGTVSYCRWYESMWLFVLTAVGSVPINIVLVCNIVDSGIFDSGFALLGNIVTWIEVYLLLLAIEEITIGILGRIFWKKQKMIHEVLEKEGAEL